MIINNVQSNNLYRKKSINFGEGKAELYSDFDRTFLPISHSKFKNIPKAENDKMLNDYFGRMGNFFNRVKDGLTFKITTGRNFDEFRTMAEMARDKGFKMPLPKSLIVKNGGDEHPKVVSDDVFYNGGEYPFKYDQINTNKQKELREQTGWNGKLLKQKLKEVFEEHGFEVREPGTTHSKDDYGFRSLFHDLYKDATKENPFPKVIGLRRDGDSKIHITYPANICYYGTKIEGKDKYQRTQDLMENKAIRRFREEDDLFKSIDSKSRGISNIHWSPLHEKGRESSGHPAVEIIPSPNLDGKPLTKLYDTQKAVERAIKDNDLVIVAGDSSNDKEMLNIGNYIKPDENTKYLKKKHRLTPEYVFEKGESLKETLELKENKALKQQLIELPIISIIVKNKDKEPPKIPEAYKEYGKVIEVEEGKLDDGIRQAVEIHAKNNPNYKKKLSKDLLKEIFPEDFKKLYPEKEVATSTIKKSSTGSSKNAKGKYGWIVGIAVALTGALGGLYAYNKKKNNNTSTQFQNNQINKPNTKLYYSR